MSTLRIKDLHVSVETSEGPKEILKGVNLTINSGEIHAIMGPNGSGKSTMAYALAGHPDYEITSGEAWLDDQLITEMSVDERAKAGLFLAMQYPVEVAGVSVSNFLRTAKTAIDGQAPALRSWVKDMKTSMENLRMDPDFAERDVNVGFSGGEKKRLEILQMELLKPSLAVLPATDTTAPLPICTIRQSPTLGRCARSAKCVLSHRQRQRIILRENIYPLLR